MPHLTTPHAAKIALGFTPAGIADQGEMTFALQDATDAMFVDPVLTCNTIFTAVIAHLVPVADAETAFNAVFFEDVRTIPYGGVDVFVTPHTGTSSIGGAVLPSCTSKSIKKTSATLGRSGRGRLFWPTLMAGWLVATDTYDAARLAAVTSGLADFQTAVEAALTPAKMGIITQQHGGVVRPNGVFEPILSWSVVNNLVDTQRRRLLGHGRHR